ncbi:gas vesicle protein GvpG [Streptomyces buecherae]|uniref:Gas vesicle protein GvpG n=1 Tax=Streptomyces buecherae TaxID=2763006 RepID=A0A7H8NHP8_9ACTN|nr:gas vesicle protein GvpG [Streptomyces buecherae]QKW53892.1 gas vesicle protein GvpG [Streptomyces buecherae]
MGLVTGLLTLPFAPVRGTAWVIDQVVTAAERQAYDPQPVRERLAALVAEREAGHIDEEEFDRREDELLDLLEWYEYRQRQLGPAER